MVCSEAVCVFFIQKTVDITRITVARNNTAYAFFMSRCLLISYFCNTYPHPQ